MIDNDLTLFDPIWSIIHGIYFIFTFGYLCCLMFLTNLFSLGCDSKSDNKEVEAMQATMKTFHVFTSVILANIKEVSKLSLCPWIKEPYVE